MKTETYIKIARSLILWLKFSNETATCLKMPFDPAALTSCANNDHFLCVCVCVCTYYILHLYLKEK